MLPLWTYGFGQMKSDYASHLVEKNIELELDFESDLTRDALFKRVNDLSNVIENGITIPTRTELRSDIVGHYLLRTVCSKNEFETDWFAKREAQIFFERIRQIRTFREKYEIIKHFFMDKVKTISEFLEFKDIEIDPKYRTELELGAEKGIGLIAIAWIYVTHLVSHRECTLINGWGIVEVNAPCKILTKWFEQNLRDQMEKIRTDTEKMDAVADLADEVDEVIREQSGMILGIEDVGDVLGMSPLCIIHLDEFLTKGEQFEYMEALQLALYLKGVGLTMEDVKRFFYFRHPANVNKSWDDWNKEGWNYYFNHLWGIAGSYTSYSAFSCSKSRDEGYCPFTGVNTRTISKDIRKRYGDVEGGDQTRFGRLLKNITKNTGKNPNTSCTAEFSLRFGIDLSRVLTHPVKGYYRTAWNITRNKRKEDEEA